MTVREIAEIVHGRAAGDETKEIRSVASLARASSQDLSYAEGERALVDAGNSQAGCILIRETASLPGRALIHVQEPKLAFIRAAQALCPAKPPEPGIHPSAVVSSEAQLAANVCVGPQAVVERGAEISEGSVIGAGVYVGENAKIGAGCVLYPRVTIYPGAQIGNRVILHAGVVIGGDGFGYVFADGEYLKFPQLGSVVIEDEVEIGANTTVDRGSLGTTVVGRGSKIDNLVQVAHNVRIGRNCIIAAQTGISGSAEIGDGVVIAGQVGIGDHARIGNGAVIGGQAGILPGKIIREGAVVWGTPARSLAEFKKLYAYFSRLPALMREMRNSPKTPMGKK
ncbi:MAG TPA: UDP-3-O-(3-hydroxymyristoyl)glucosamine N-acyltransferase [Terriglobia bacterium]|nr:UDP-3-O-(3-hydroxymyristoyl)glucosamine N-acyltransferase [Terriglobia bacterium]